MVRVRARFTIEPNDNQQVLATRFDTLLEAGWHTEADHKALLKAAAAAGELAFIGSRYRAVLDVIRDEPRAKQAQNELLTLAMATITTVRGDEPPQSATARNIMMVLLVLVIGGGVFVLMRTVIGSLQGLGGDGLGP
jgi:hypothetical protein